MKLRSLLETEYGIQYILSQHMDQIKIKYGPEQYRQLQEVQQHQQMQQHQQQEMQQQSPLNKDIGGMSPPLNDGFGTFGGGIGGSPF